jgi:hypothetical protein
MGSLLTTVIVKPIFYGKGSLLIGQAVSTREAAPILCKHLQIRGSTWVSKYLKNKFSLQPCSHEYDEILMETFIDKKDMSMKYFPSF